jgi:hypothetical protein
VQETRPQQLPPREPPRIYRSTSPDIFLEGLADPALRITTGGPYIVELELLPQIIQPLLDIELTEVGVALRGELIRNRLLRNLSVVVYRLGLQ